MSFDLFNFMNNISQVSKGSNCDLFNFGKNSKMQPEKSNYNSQNANQNFNFTNDSNYNPENLLLQFNNNNNNLQSQSQRSNANFLYRNNNNNNEYFNFSEFQFQNQIFDQENNFIPNDKNDSQINHVYNNTNRDSQVWQEINNTNNNFSYANDNNCQKINEDSLNSNNTFTNKNSSENLYSHTNNLTSSKTSTKSNKNLNYFKNNNTNRSPRHIVETLKIINEAVENENNDDLGFFPQNQTPEKNKSYNNIDKQYFFSNNKSIKEQKFDNINNDTHQKSCLENNKQNNKKTYNHEIKFENKQSANTNQNSIMNNQNNGESNKSSNNANNINYSKEDTKNSININNQLDLFPSINKYQDAFSSINKEISNFPVNNIILKEQIKDIKNTNNFMKDVSNLLKDNTHNTNQELKTVKNIELQKLCDDLETLENDLFSTLTFKKRNFFDFNNPQSQEIMDRIRHADLEELSKLLNYKGKEFKGNEYDNELIQNKPQVKENDYSDNNQRNNDSIKIAYLPNCSKYDDFEKQSIKNNNSENNFKQHESQPRHKDNKLVNNLSIAANFKNLENNDKIVDERFDDKSLDNPKETKNESLEVLKNTNKITYNSINNQRNSDKNMNITPVPKKSENPPNSRIDFESVSLSNKNQTTKIYNISNLESSEQYDSTNRKNNLNYTIEEEKANSIILSNLNEHQHNGKQFKANKAIEDKSEIKANRIQESKKIYKDKKLNNFQKNNMHIKKNTFCIDQVTLPQIDSLKNSFKNNEKNYINDVFVPLSDEEIEKLASTNSLASISNMFESKKCLVKYANDLTDNFSKIFIAVENFRSKFKNYWEIYLLNYIMEVEYYNYILGKIDENSKYDFNKIENNVAKIAMKYQNDDL